MHRLVVLIGAPRSGTSWLQRTLGNHPDIVAPQELHFFHNYLGALADTWTRQTDHAERVVSFLERGSPPPGRLIGLPTLLDAADFDEACRGLYDVVAQRVHRSKPSASIFLEKTPSTSLRTELINRLWPDAMFIHLIRDPQAVVRSLLAVSQWSQSWRIADARHAAAIWREHVTRAAAAREYGPRYLEVRYEQLQRDGAAAIAEICDFLGIQDTTPSVIETPADDGEHWVLSSQYTQRLRDKRLLEPTGFNNEGGTGRRELTPSEYWQMQRECGDVMRQFGYAADPAAQPSMLTSAALAARARGRAGAGAMKRQLTSRRRAR